MTVSEITRTAAFAALEDELDVLTAWLRHHALPLWADRGVDHTNGGFYELLTQSGSPLEQPRRTRLVARQIYVFASAGDVGWLDTAISRELVGHGLDFLLNRSFTGSGPIRSAVGPGGEPLRPDFDLYDHAFALFALGTAARLGHRREIVAAVGHDLLDTMVADWKHPLAGFEEAKPPREPLQSSPHLHLLEAFLEWERVAAEPCWREFSDEIVRLALSKFIDPRTGAIGECFDHDWNRSTGEMGRYLEPGHHFEWAWLLWRWGLSRSRYNDVFPAVLRLTEIAETHGINTYSGLAMNGIWADLSARDRQSRLWPQTERLKANIAIAESTVGQNREQALKHASEAAAGLRRYFDTDITGLWHETLSDRGHPIPGPARASSLYHILGAVQELDRFVNRHNSDG